MERQQEHTWSGTRRKVASILARWFVTTGAILSRMTTPIVQAQWEALRKSLASEDAIGGQSSKAGASGTEAKNNVKVACCQAEHPGVLRFPAVGGCLAPGRRPGDAA